MIQNRRLNRIKSGAATFMAVFVLLCFSNLANADAKVTIKYLGVKQNIRKNIRARVTLEQEKSNEKLNNQRIERLIEIAPDEIKEALTPFGYYAAKLEKSVTQNGDQWKINFKIKLGEPLRVKISDLQFSGAAKSQAVFQKMFAEFPLTENSVVNQLDYEKFKSDLLTLADDLGYFDAEFSEQKITVDLLTYSAEVHLHFDSGPRYEFGPVTFNQKTFNDDFLQRFVDFKTGEPYSGRKLLTLQSELSNNEYFEYVDVEAERENIDEGQVPIAIALQPRKAHTYTAGVGYGTDTGARALAGWHWRRVTDTGHRFSTQIKAAQYQSNAEASYFIPGRKPASDVWSFSLGWINDAPPDRNIESETFKAQGSYLWDNPQTSWQKGATVSWQHESYIDTDSDQESQIILPSLTLEHISAENRMKVDEGYRIRFEVRGTDKALLLSTTSFAQGLASGKWIHRFTPRQRILLRGDLGTSINEEEQEIPPSLRFYAGGDNSVRGFGYQSLGEKRVTSEGKTIVIGGRNLMVGSLEYELAVSENWRAATFVDSGNAFDHFSDPLATGAGVGVRWISPVGPVRLDVAAALSESDTPWRIHFTVGPDL